MCEESESKLQFVLQCDGPRCSARALPLTAGAAPVRPSAVHRLPKRDVKPQFLEQARFRRIHAEQQRRVCISTRLPQALPASFRSN